MMRLVIFCLDYSSLLLLIFATKLHLFFSRNKQGGDGLCCVSGEGSYSIYSKGKLLVVGNSFGTSAEHSIRIDYADFLDSGNNESQASWNTPSTPPPTVPLTTLAPMPTVSPSPTAKPVSPTAQLAADQKRWYCGMSWDWVVQNCADAIPCPGGDASGTLQQYVFMSFC